MTAKKKTARKKKNPGARHHILFDDGKGNDLFQKAQEIAEETRLQNASHVVRVLIEEHGPKVRKRYLLPPCE